MGPKPHVLAAMLCAKDDPEIAFRFPQTSSQKPVQVVVPDDANPYVDQILVSAPESAPSIRQYFRASAFADPQTSDSLSIYLRRS